MNESMGYSDQLSRWGTVVNNFSDMNCQTIYLIITLYFAQFNIHK